jgi:BMFP domain-containing protein YqiC
MKNPLTLAAALGSMIFVVSAGAQVKTKAPAGKPPAPQRVDNETLRLNAEVIRTSTEYRDQLALQMKLEESEIDRLAREVEFRAQWFNKDYISRQEWEQSKQALARARAKQADTAQRIEQAEMVIGEAEARAALLTLPPLAAGGYSESGMFVRYNGTAPWSLADSGKIETFFAARFGHPMPVSARGETEVHRQMRFDHANAIDVALQPDSTEGRALMEYLRKVGIPFLAFRGKMKGSSTGAHIHIGKPSVRLAGP